MTPLDEVLAYFRSLSNWGRWGAEDTVGTLNYVTRRNRLDALRLARVGDSFGLGRVLAPPREPSAGLPVMHFMTQSGADAPATGPGIASDWLALEFHGYGVTHLDAPGHMFWDGSMYNGRPASAVDHRRGARHGSVELIGEGLVTRGVLLDIVRFREDRGTDPDTPVTAQELSNCCAHQAVEVAEGDVLITRVGRDLPAVADGQDRRRGLEAGSLPWIHEHRVAMIGSDGTNDARPSGYESIPAPLHAIGIVAMGLWLMDNLYLEDLATTCAARNSWDFCFVLNALRIKGGTGSPINPMAIL
jgi:kynurenine formamidase